MESLAEDLIQTILSNMDDYVSEMINVPRWVNVVSGEKFISRCTRSGGRQGHRRDKRDQQKQAGTFLQRKQFELEDSLWASAEMLGKRSLEQEVFFSFFFIFYSLNFFNI